MISEFENVLDQSWRAVEARRDLIAGGRVERPVAIPKEAAIRNSRSGTDFPVLDHFSGAVTAVPDGDLGELAGRVAALGGALEWSQNSGYTADNSTRSFLDGYAYASLSGPEGPVLCEAPMAGFMLLGPNVHYPDHRHAPREVYLVLTPGARWNLDGEGWFDVAAGSVVVHNRWQAHAIMTGDTPFLAFAAWLEPGPRDGIRWG